MYQLHIFALFIILIYFGFSRNDVIESKQYRLADVGSESGLVSEIRVGSESAMVLYDNVGMETAEIAVFKDTRGYILDSNCSMISFDPYFFQLSTIWMTWKENYLRLGMGSTPSEREFAALANFSSRIKYVAFLSVNGTSEWNVLSGSKQNSTVEFLYSKREGKRLLPVSRIVVVGNHKGDYSCLFLCNQFVACSAVNVLRDTPRDGLTRCEIVLFRVRNKGGNCSPNNTNQLNNHTYQSANGWIYLQKKLS